MVVPTKIFSFPSAENSTAKSVKFFSQHYQNPKTYIYIYDVYNKKDVYNLATTTAVTAVENKIPSVSNVVYSTKISEIENKITTDHDHDKYITTQEFNRLTSENFTARLRHANLASKNDIVNFVKKTSSGEKLKTVT